MHLEYLEINIEDSALLPSPYLKVSKCVKLINDQQLCSKGPHI